MRILIFILMILSYMNLFGQECKEFLKRQPLPQLHKAKTLVNGYNITHHKIELQADPRRQDMSGIITTAFIVEKDSISTIPFHLDDAMRIDSAFFNKQKVTFTHRDQIVTLELKTFLRKSEIHSVRVHYHGNPTKSFFQSYRVDNHGQDSARAPIIWTLSEPYGSQDWWPCKNTLDDKIDSIDLIVTTPVGNKVAGNGLLMSVLTLNDSIAVHHWKHCYPIATYLIAFAITNYVEYTDTVRFNDGRKLDILNYVYPEYLSSAKKGTPETIKIMQLFDSLFGPYPFMKEKYGHAMFGKSGGMEHQTMSFMGNFGYGLVAHELAHQWFGDMVTCGSWPDLWLNESFATYLTALCYQYHKPAEWPDNIAQIKADVVKETDGSVYATDTADWTRLFNSRLTYKKGAMVLHTLRFMLGDSLFFQAIRNYLTDAKVSYGFARTRDLQNQFEKSSGLNLDYFFDQWIMGEGHPVYKIVWSQIDKHLKLSITQTPSHPSVAIFEIPVPVLFKGKNGSRLVVLKPEQLTDHFSFELPFQVDTMVIDPYTQILGVGEALRTGGSADRVIVFPNPANDFVYLQTGDKTLLSFHLFSVNGQEVLSLKMQPEVYEIPAIDLRGLSTGMYFYRCETDQGAFQGKLMVNHNK